MGHCVTMATNLQIDDELLAGAQRVGRFKTKKNTVNQALADFVRCQEQRASTELFGTIEFTEGFDHKVLRQKRRECSQTAVRPE